MKKSITSLVVFVSVVLVTSFYAYTSHMRNKAEMELYATIFNINNSLFELNNIVVLSNPSTCESNTNHYISLPTETVKSFLEANSNGAAPIRLSNLEGKVPIVSWSDQKKMHNEGSIKLFKPSDIRLLRLSRAGFNKDRTNAIVCIESYEGTYGNASLIFLEKNNDKWKQTKNISIWVS